ncbi:MAG: hypothetical protein GY773_12335, partial [Actinomycetia bacterium]|nr:hypothetical protein [Actinomycetes bacterium]
MANREQRRQRRKEQHRARRRARKLGFDPRTINEWAALIVEAALVEIRDLISLPDRILKEIGAGQGIQLARALLPPPETGLQAMSLDGWEAFLDKSGA